MTRLSVNINKIALIRNARGKNIPDVLKAAFYCEEHGAQGITVHPRPDERHIKYTDVYNLKKYINTELNIEGYPSRKFMDMVSDVKPAQVTLVPDPPDALTSNTGWDAKHNTSYLIDIIAELHDSNIRTSLFMNPDPEQILYAAKTNTDRIELYTEPYASQYQDNKAKAIQPYIEAAKKAQDIGIGLNSGHDLNRNNLRYYVEQIPGLLEVSIGHALIVDALYFGLENTIQMYRRLLE